MKCPNKSSRDYKIISKVLGEDAAFETWYNNNHVIPSLAEAREMMSQSDKRDTPVPKRSLDSVLTATMKSIGVNYESVTKVFDEQGKEINAVAKADLFNRTIQVVEGKKNIATLPEEAAHIFMALLPEESALYRQMMNKVADTAMYQQVKDQYNDIYNDNTKLKLEAIGKLIAQEVIGIESQHPTMENSGIQSFIKKWFNNIIKKLKGIFIKTTSDQIADTINPYRTVAKQLLDGDTRGLKKIEDLTPDDYTYSPIFYELSEETKEEVESLVATFKELEANQGDIRKLETEHGYRTIIDGVWKKVKRSVTSLVDKHIVRMMPGKKKSEFSNNIYSQTGTFSHAIATNTQKAIHEFMSDKSYSEMSHNKEMWESYFSGIISDIVQKSKDETIKLKDMPKDDSFYTFATDGHYRNTINIAKRAWKQYEVIAATQDRINKQTQSDGRLEIFVEVPIYDPTSELGGSIDNLVIYSNGMGGIWDWKFKHNYRETSTLDSQKYDVQIGEYKKILYENYGIETFAETRIIPMSFGLNKEKTAVKYINYGSNIKDQDNSMFGDVSTADEKRGDELDKILEKLYNEKKSLEEKQLTSRRKKDKEDISRLDIRLAKINNIIDSLVVERDVSNIAKLLNFITSDLRKRFSEPYDINKTTPNSNAVNDEILSEANDILGIFDDFTDFYGTTLTKEEMSDKTNNELGAITYAISELRSEISGKLKESLNRFLRGGDVSSTNKEGTFQSNWFVGLADQDRPVLQKLSEVASNINFEWEEELRDFEFELKKHLANIDKDGISAKRAFEKLVDRKKGALLSKFKKDVRTVDLQKALDTNDLKWMKENTDLQISDKGTIGYSEESNAKIAKRLEEQRASLEEKFSTHPNKQEMVDAGVLNTRDYFYSNEFMTSAERNYFINIKETGATLNRDYHTLPSGTKGFYDFLVEFNTKAAEQTLGKTGRYFIPEIQASILSTISQNGLKSITSLANMRQQLSIAFSTREQDSLTGPKDANGNPLFDIPLLMTDQLKGTILDSDVANLTEEIKKEEAERLKKDPDYVEMDEEDFKLELDRKKMELSRERGKDLKSYDLAQSFYLYAQSIFTHKHLKEYEYYAKNLISFSKDKYANRSIETSSTGKPLKNKLKNTIATKLGMGTSEQDTLQKYVNYIFYGQKLQGKDIEIGGVSVNKVVKKTMAYMSFSRIGGNVLSAAGNVIGATSNLLIEGSNGRYDKSKIISSIKYMKNNFSKQAALADYFGIGETAFEKGKKLSSEFIDKHITMDKWYALMKYPDMALKQTILTTMMQSYGVNENNEIENLKNLPKGTKSLLEQWDYNKDSGKVEFDLPKKEIIRFRTMVAKEADLVLGTMSEDNLRLYRTNLLAMVLMQFKNWMPGLVKARFGELKYDSDFKDFTEGRYRATFGQLVGGERSFLNKAARSFGFLAAHIPIIGYLTRLSPSLRGLKKINDTLTESQFKAFYELNKERFVNTTYEKALEQFKNNKQANMNAFGKELNIMLFFVMSILILGNMGDEDEDKAMRANLAYKMLQRGSLELSFFFNPMDTYQIAKRPLPALGVIRDIINLDLKGILPVTNTIRQIGYDDFLDINK